MEKFLNDQGLAHLLANLLAAQFTVVDSPDDLAGVSAPLAWVRENGSLDVQSLEEYAAQHDLGIGLDPVDFNEAIGSLLTSPANLDPPMTLRAYSAIEYQPLELESENLIFMRGAGGFLGFGLIPTEGDYTHMIVAAKLSLDDPQFDFENLYGYEWGAGWRVLLNGDLVPSDSLAITADLALQTGGNNALWDAIIEGAAPRGLYAQPDGVWQFVGPGSGGGLGGPSQKGEKGDKGDPGDSGDPGAAGVTGAKGVAFYGWSTAANLTNS